MKKTKRFFSILILTAISVFGYQMLDIYLYAKKPGSATVGEKAFTITPGQSLNTISRKLAEDHFITHPKKFTRLAKLKKKTTSIKAGEYILSPGFSPSEILDVITSGKVKLYKITIPEGFNMHQIGDLLQEKQMITKEAFVASAEDQDLLKEIGVDGETFEGYLYPDTYHFPKGITAKGIIRTMVKRFREVMTPEFEKRAKELKLSVHQVMTLASIIEKETGDPSERPIISSVFHNRLKKRMRLESDPTVIYGIKNFNGNITRKDLRTYTPYNTYKIKGLPPGPIANPGKAAIEAALYPDDTSYFYFVAKKNGTHYFSKTIREHNRAVRKYQLRRK